MRPTRLQKTKKIAGHYMYERLGCSATNMKRFGSHWFQLLLYKNKPKVVLFDDRDQITFHSNTIISPSEARELIGWLARYIALSDPDPVSLSIAATKVHAKEITREQVKIAKELGL